MGMYGELEDARVGELPLGPAHGWHEHAGKAARVLPKVGAEEMGGHTQQQAWLLVFTALSVT